MKEENDCPELGDKHGRFTVIGSAPSRGGKRYLKVKCSCGTIKEVCKWNITSGHIVSCGCASKEAQGKFFKRVKQKLV
jgi:hypothetical protein